MRESTADIALEPSGGSRLSLYARLSIWESAHGLYATAALVALGTELLSFLLISRVTMQFHTFSRLLWPAEDPLGVLPYVLPEHRHRVLGPLLAYVLQLRGAAALMIPVLANLGLHATGYVWLRRQAVRPDLALAVVVLVGTTLVVAANRMVFGFQDSLAALGLVLVLGATRPWLAALWLGLFMLADERIVTGAPLVLAWWWLGGDARPPRRELLLRAGALACAALASLALSQVIRVHTGVADAASEHLRETFTFELLKDQAGVLGLGYFLALRGAWLLPVVAWLCLLRRSRRDALLFLGAVLVTLPAAALVADVSRVAAFCAVPSVYIGAVLIGRNPPFSLRQAVTQALAVNLLCPCFHVVGESLVAGYPLPIQLVVNYLETGRLTLVLFH